MKNNLRKFREQKNLTQFNLAVKVDLYPSTITSYEQGKTFPDIHKAREIANILGASVSDIWPE